jgi:hypothetical protein
MCHVSQGCGSSCGGRSGRGGSCGSEREFPRRFRTRGEDIASLQSYLDELQKETQAVQENIAVLKNQ